MMRTAAHTGPLPVAELQRMVDLSAYGADSAACIPSADGDKVHTIPFALVAENVVESAYTGIRKTVRKVMIRRKLVYLRDCKRQQQETECSFLLSNWYTQSPAGLS